MSWARRALLSGVTGTLCEAALTRLEQRRMGRAPFDTGLMAERLGARWGINLDAPSARALGSAMRWGYGPSWGMLVTLATRRARWPVAGLMVGAGLFVFELAMLPRTGATPPVERWGARFVAADLVNALIYAEVAAMTAALLRRFTTGPRATVAKEGSHGTDGQ